METVYVDKSALEAIILNDHMFHSFATDFLKTTAIRSLQLVSSPQVLYEIADELKAKGLGRTAITVTKALRLSGIITFIPLSKDDEKAAWKIYESLAEPGWTFTQCSGMALINRKKIQTVFGFTSEYRKLGLKLIPEVTL